MNVGTEDLLECETTCSFSSSPPPLHKFIELSVFTSKSVFTASCAGVTTRLAWFQQLGMPRNSIPVVTNDYVKNLRNGSRIMLNCA